MSSFGGGAAPAGSLGLMVVRATGVREVSNLPDPGWAALGAPSLADIRRHGCPQRGLSDEVNRWRAANLPNLWRGARRVFAARALRLPHFYGQVWLRVIRVDGDVVDLGLASLRVVTTAGVRFICDDFNANTTDVTNMKFHGIGTGATAEAAADTALQTELTTQYNPDNTRATGTQASATVSANATYTTVGTNTVDATAAVTEHGILSQAATGGGTLLDRSVFSVVNLASGDSLQSTYVFTVNSGG